MESEVLLLDEQPEAAGEAAGEIPAEEFPVEAAESEIILEHYETEAAASVTIDQYGHIAVTSIPLGILTGAIFMVVGLAVAGIVKIFKHV